MMLTMGQSWFAKLLGNPKSDLEKFLSAAQTGDAQAQFNLGSFFFDTADFQQAAHWYLQAANHDHARAEFALGGMLASGRGVPRDEAQAAVWIGKAANQGCPEAQHALGLRCRRAGFEASPEDAPECTWKLINGSGSLRTKATRAPKLSLNVWPCG
jgi:TPR repeat protein